MVNEVNAVHISSDRLLLTGVCAQEAADQSLRHMATRCSGSGGAVVIATDGAIGKAFTTERMAWATIKKNVINYGLDLQDDFEEKIQA